MVENKSGSRKAERKHRIELTSMSAFLWGAFLFFLLAWIFVLGILVGRGFLAGPGSTIADLKEPIKKLQEMVGKKGSTDLSSQKDLPQKQDPKLAFYEKLSTKKEEVRKSGTDGKEGVNPDRAAPDKGSKGSNSPVEEKKVEPDPSASTKAQASPAGAVQYTVQLAFLEDRVKAERQVIKLIGMGFDAYLYESKLDGRNFYRVRCGTYVNREEAAAFARKIEEKSGLKGFVSKVE